MRSIVFAIAAGLCSALSACSNPSFPAVGSFPAIGNLSDVTMKLERTICLGSCPSYTVEVRGDGKVSYHGDSYVLVKGDYSWTIPQADVVTLIDVFRKAGYFDLKDRYVIGWTDLPSTTSSISIRSASKEVYDYGGGECDKEIEPDPPCMPNTVYGVEEAIDRLSGAASLVEADSKTPALLDRIGFDFKSATAASTLLQAITKRDVALATLLVDRGAPLDGGGIPTLPGLEDNQPPAIALAPSLGDPNLVQRMIARGALADRSAQDAFLLASAFAANPEFVRMALTYIPDLAARKPLIPWMIAAARAKIPDEGTLDIEEMAKPKYAAWIKAFDQGRVMRILVKAGADVKAKDRDHSTALHVASSADAAQVLIDAGADVDATDDEGETPLHKTNNPEVAAVLIKAGADVSARNANGKTPLFDKYDVETVRLLLKAGAKVDARDTFGETPLFYCGDGEVTSALLQAGADMNARDRSGRTTLDFCRSTDAALVLVRAGAQLPTDPAKWARLFEWAKNNEAEELVKALQHASAAAKSGR